VSKQNQKQSKKLHQNYFQEASSSKNKKHFTYAG